MKSFFKKLCLLLLTISLLLSTTSCLLTLYTLTPLPTRYTVTGIDNYRRSNSPYETTVFFLPDEPYEFLKAYPYVRGDYDYYELLDNSAYETVILYVEYAKDSYDEAKSYAIQNLCLVEESVCEYKQYTFMQNERCPSEKQRMFFGYCDEKRLLVFIGTYMDGQYDYQYSTLAEYLETYFSFYNWEEGKIERTTATAQEAVGE